MKIKFSKEDESKLIDLFEKKNIRLEGNILKIIESDNDDFKKYITDSIDLDNSKREKRLSLTKKLQAQNKELTQSEKDNKKLMAELRESLEQTQEQQTHITNQNSELIQWKEKNQLTKEKLKKALKEAELAKHQAETDLDVLQKKSQYELIGSIVRVALFVIVSVSVIATVMYIVAIFVGRETQIIGSTWSNLLGILLTNAFSIVGTITGVKYADNAKQQSTKQEKIE